MRTATYLCCCHWSPVFFSFKPDTFGCSEEVLTIAAMLQVQHIFLQPSRQRVSVVSYRTIVAWQLICILLLKPYIIFSHFDLLIFCSCTFYFYSTHVFSTLLFFILSQEKVHRQFCVYEGDHITMLNVYRLFVKVYVLTCMHIQHS